MQSQRLDQMNDLWQDRLLDAYERQQERDYEEMVNEEPEPKDWSPSEQDYIDCFQRRREFELLMYQNEDHK